MLLIDGRPLQSASTVRGIGSYVRGLLGGMAEIGALSDTELLLAHGKALPAELQQLRIQPARVRVPAIHPTLQAGADPIFIAATLQRLKPRLYHGVEWGQPVWSRAPVVMTVHDLIPFVFPRHYPWVRRSHWVALRLLRHADRVIAVSNCSASDLVRLARVPEERIDVIPEGVAEVFQPAPAEAVAAVRRLYALDRPFVLAVGTFDPRKRIRNLARVARLLMASHDVDLVIAGDQGTFAGAVAAALENERVASRSHVLGRVDIRELVALYTGAACLVFTSAYEGFGLPPLEAMRCGTPVVMYRNSSLPEVAGPTPLVPDGDADAMADAAGQLLEDTAHRTRRGSESRAWAEQFTWRRTAERTRDVYEVAIAAHVGHARPIL